MNFPKGFDPVLLPTPERLLFWGFVIASGIGVAQLSTKLSERLFRDDVNQLDDEEIEATNENGEEAEGDEVTEGDEEAESSAIAVTGEVEKDSKSSKDGDENSSVDQEQ